MANKFPLLLYRSLENIQVAIKECLTELKEIAMEDKVISVDELAILNKISYDFENLETQVIQVLESELHEEEFQDLITDFLNDVIKNVTDLAMADQVITEDEQRLIDRVMKFVEDSK